MQCPLRSGKERIEYNPAIIEAMPDIILRDLMRVEIIRILLQHPYARQPMGCPSIVLQKASDMVISPAYNLAWANLARPEDFDLPTGQNYEWYAMRLNEKAIHRHGDAPNEGNSEGEQGEGSQGQGDGQGEQQEQDEKAVHQDGDAPSRGNSGGQQGEGSSQTTEAEQDQEQGQGGSQQGEEATEGNSHQSTDDGQSNEGDDEASASDKPSSGYTDLWEEDPFQSRMITDIVQSSSQWGSLPGDMVELIKKAAEGKIGYRGVLRMFRSSILSQKRHLTRMRPSRRFGFEQMGSRYEFTTRLLVAIDTSGSVGSNGLARYFRILTTFFKYGIQEIDVLMFDTVVQGKLMTLTEAKKNKQTFEVKGRGGTNFQVPIDYVTAHPDYDGLIILTDGEAPVPKVPALLRAKILWVIDNAESFYKRYYEDFRKTGRVCWMEL
jgi:predicted metal-dependent peptidase